jgi:hypothetical protein
MEIQRSDQKLCPFRTGIVVSSEDTSASSSIDSTSTPKKSLLIWKLRNPYRFGYAFIYTKSKLKQTLMNPISELIWGPLTIKPK